VVYLLPGRKYPVEEKQFLFNDGIHKCVERYFFGDEENMKIKIYSNSDKKCGDNVYGN